MDNKTELPDPESIEGYPKGQKVTMLACRGHIRVVERNYYWSKEKRRGLEKRKYLGYVVDGRYYPNDEYRRQFKQSGRKRLVPLDARGSGEPGGTILKHLGSLDILKAGALPLYYRVAQDIGLVDDLTAVWGKQAADAVLSIAFHWLSTSSNAASRFKYWARGRLLPYPGVLSDKELGELFAQLAGTSGWRQAFFGARVSRMPEDEMLSFDATAIASEAQQVSYVRFGADKEGGYQRQVGLIVLVGHKTNMPVLFRVLPGNITDVTTVQDMLFRFGELTGGKKVFAAVVDREYFSQANIARFIDGGSRAIMAANLSSSWTREAVEEAMEHLWDSSAYDMDRHCWGCTVPMLKTFDDGIERRVWFHVYRSDAKTDTETRNFYERLRRFQSDWMAWRPARRQGAEECPLLKSPLMKYYRKGAGIPGREPLQQDYDAINHKIRYFGTFCNVTTMECTAWEAMVDYRARDMIEKTFKAGRSLLEMDAIRAHSDEVMEGRLIVSFCAMSILNRIYTLMKRPTVRPMFRGKDRAVRPLSEEYSFSDIRDILDPTGIVFNSKGNGFWQEVTRIQHDIARRLGYPDLYKEVPDWHSLQK